MASLAGEQMVELVTVIAAIAQIVAAIFAWITIRQARIMIDKADAQFRASVAPAWELPLKILAPEWDHEKHIQRLDLTITNSGLGPARSLGIEFKPNTGVALCREDGTGNPATETPILPGHIHSFKLYWEYGKPLNGILVIRSTSRLGVIETAEYDVDSQLVVPENRSSWVTCRPRY